MNSEREHSPENATEFTPQKVLKMVLENQIQFFEISICSGNSSVEVVGGDESLLLLTGLDYNEWTVNSYRCVLQSLPDHAQVTTLSRERENISTIRELEIVDNSGNVYHATLVSMGINNKFNRLKFTRHPK